jgi:signal peptidase I
MFKLTRHFNASKVITATAKRAYKQILGMISFLVFLVILFAILLYQVESGRSCYVGDVDCHPPPDAPGLHIGDRIRINKNGDLSSFSNVFYGLWYSFVTLTSTG